MSEFLDSHSTGEWMNEQMNGESIDRRMIRLMTGRLNGSISGSRDRWKED